MDARIAQQQKIIAALNSEIKSLRLSIDENGQIRDEAGRAIGQIVSINNQLVIQRKLEDRIDQADAETAASRERQAAMLAEAERILQRLATS